MKIRLTENKLREMVNESIKELIQEEYQATPMEEIVSLCKYIKEHDLSYYEQLLDLIPQNTQRIIEGVTERLNAMNINPQFISLEYSDYDYKGYSNLALNYTVDFTNFINNSDYTEEEWELFEIVGDQLGIYNYNYGGEGYLEAIVRTVDIDNNNIVIILRVDSMVNPNVIQSKLSFE